MATRDLATDGKKWAALHEDWVFANQDYLKANRDKFIDCAEGAALVLRSLSSRRLIGLKRSPTTSVDSCKLSCTKCSAEITPPSNLRHGRSSSPPQSRAPAVGTP
jgi:hypothetical protein